MRIIIEAPLLVSQQVVDEPFALPSIWQLCVDQDCHYVELDPPESPEFEQWKKTVSRNEARTAIELLDQGARKQAREPSTTALRIADVQTVDWNGPVPRFPFALARRLLYEPLSVLLEGPDDEFFLRATVPHIYRERFESLLETRGLKLTFHGGVDNVGKAIEQAERFRESRLRRFVMVDSDARKPGAPAAKSRRIINICGHHNVPCHQLQRRAIENYLPLPALERWLKKSYAKNFAQHWADKLRAFHELSGEQRHHYNMKHGLKNDRGTPEGLSELFLDLVTQSPKQAQLLDGGFTGAVAKAFQDPVEEQWLMDDGQGPELMRLFETMLRAA